MISLCLIVWCRHVGAGPLSAAQVNKLLTFLENDEGQFLLFPEKRAGDVLAVREIPEKRGSDVLAVREIPGKREGDVLAAREMPGKRGSDVLADVLDEALPQVSTYLLTYSIVIKINLLIVAADYTSQMNNKMCHVTTSIAI